jgi:hypothetical protein
LGVGPVVVPAERLAVLREAVRSAFAWAVVLGGDGNLEQKASVRFEVTGDVVQLYQGDAVVVEMTRQEFLAVAQDIGVIKP